MNSSFQILVPYSKMELAPNPVSLKEELVIFIMFFNKVIKKILF